ncbi:BadF/BadG/BcrA/BcrD ATPase family protein [Paenibacillus xanthanilyticus]|uniref:BadF/BadG/BcrA/BcrD ATPase family protein n=1 Tax=Paenibacillus xanthanilyticus TaxID=1783531 RepID=A0ABV8KEH7_9BACL
MSSGNLIIGIDGGGSKTRVAIADMAGSLLLYHEYPRAASRYKDHAAQENVHTAIHAALAKAGRSLSDVGGIAAGVAGFDKDEDLVWVQELTNLPGLSCPRWHVNDAIVAHYGALVAKPGIVAISGTGSNIFSINESGAHLRNYDYYHYAPSAARFLSYETVYEVLAGHTDSSDQPLIDAMLRYWGAASLMELNRIGLNGFRLGEQERNRVFASFAPTVTQAALEGGSLAQRVCNRAIHQLLVGIKLLARNFSSDPVPVACIGSVILSPYFQHRLVELSGDSADAGFEIVTTQFPPAIGAILYAMEQLQIPINDEVITTLEQARNLYEEE